jgi:hypothetical protein
MGYIALIAIIFLIVVLIREKNFYKKLNNMKIQDVESIEDAKIYIKNKLK